MRDKPYKCCKCGDPLSPSDFLSSYEGSGSWICNGCWCKRTEYNTWLLAYCVVGLLLFLVLMLVWRFS